MASPEGGKGEKTRGGVGDRDEEEAALDHLEKTTENLVAWMANVSQLSGWGGWGGWMGRVGGLDGEGGGRDGEGGGGGMGRGAST